MNGKNTTIKDIAKLAGVSVGTVDRVLHNRGKVSPDAAVKVKNVLNQIEYKPNLIARTLGSNKRYHIASLIPDAKSDDYWSQSSIGIQQAAIEWAHYGVSIDLFPFELHSRESFNKSASAVLEAQPDACLVAPLFYQEALPFFQQCEAKEIPYVLFNTNIHDIKPLSFIGQNLFQSGKVAAELIHIGQSNHITLAVLHIDEDIENSVHLLEKERGFKEYFQEIMHNYSCEINVLTLGAANTVQFKKQLTDLIAIKNLKGIFVSTSKAFEVASYLEKAGRNDIRLIGYDLLDENLKNLNSGVIDFLINQNPKKQASMGIATLANYLVFKKEPTPSHLFPLEIITKHNLDSYLKLENQDLPV